MKRISWWFTCLTISALLFISLAPVAYAGVPSLPHTFYGTVKINGTNAPTGTTVVAKVDGVACGSYTTSEAGTYGDLEKADHLVVQGTIDEGATINFYVNNADTSQTASFIPGGGPTELNLAATISTEGNGVAVGGGGPAPPSLATVEANLFAETVEFSIDNDGVIQKTIEATSEDGNLTITIPKNTIALDKDGNPLDSLEAAPSENPPDPPEDANIIGLAYDFEPDGATFDPSITLVYTYDPSEIPEGVAEANLILAYYDEEADKWVSLDCTVDTETHTITASVSHFTTFAVLGYEEEAPALAAFTLGSLNISPSEVNIGEKVTISILIANIGETEGNYIVTLKINGVKETDKSITIAAGATYEAIFITSQDAAGSYSVDVNGLTGSFKVRGAPTPPAPPAPPPPPSAPTVKAVNWPIIGGVIAAVIVLVSLIVLTARRRA